MRRSAVSLCAILIFASVLPVHAGDRVGIGVKVGPLGLGVDLTGHVTNRFSVRGTLNAADVSQSQEASDVDYDADLALGAYGVLLDDHPFKGSRRRR